MAEDCLEMADTAKHEKGTNAVPMFWASTGKSAKQDTIVPGVNDIGNMRPRVKGGKTKEVRAYVPIKQPVVETTNSLGRKTSIGMPSDISTIETDLSTLKSKEVSLRDLCVEDKRRVANLIKELAKVVEEKENAEHNLASERNHYQEQILKLVEQQETVLKEREDVQKKLLEYQNMIVRLQQQQQHLQQQQQQQRNQVKTKNRSPDRKVRLEAPPVPPKETKRSETMLLSQRHVTSHGHGGVERDNVANLLSQPPLGTGDDEEEDEEEEEDDSNMLQQDETETPLDQPSQNLYMNILEDSDLDEFSTQALPALSPPPLSGQAAVRPAPHRPFTVMIDQELARQQAALSTMDHVPQGARHGHGLEKIEQSDGYGHRVAPDKASPNRKLKSMSPPMVVAEKKKDGSRDIIEGLPRDDGMAGQSLDVNYVLPSQPLVSPEKAEIFSRFMHSQSHDRHMSRRHDANMAEIEGKTNDVPRKNSDKNDRRKQKKKKRPPTSFGGFHPPVMSSTQKSSEFGDYVDSTINSENNKIGDVKERHPQGMEKMSDEDSEKSDNERWAKRQQDEKYDGRNGKHRQQERDKRRGKSRLSKLKGKSKVEFSEQLAHGEGVHSFPLDAVGHVGVDPDYLSYYKNLSGAERKRELLKQRSMLLEEQNKLRKILTEQGERLKAKQAEAEATAKFETGQDFQEEDKLMKKRLQDSLEEMEFRLAQKEETVRREREILQQKRREQLDQRIVSDIPHEHNREHDNKSSNPELESHPMPAINPGLRVKAPDGDGMVLQAANSATSRNARDSQEPVLRRPDKNSPIQVKDEAQGDDVLVRRLDYSFHSDTEVLEPEKNQWMESEATPSKNAVGNKEFSPGADTLRRTDEPGNLPPGTADVGTSISFAHLPRESSKPAARGEAVHVDAREGREKGRQPRHFQASPGDKTMAVIEIINSLDSLEALETHPSQARKTPPPDLRTVGKAQGSGSKKQLNRKQATENFQSFGSQAVLRNRPVISSLLSEQRKALTLSHPRKSHLQSRSQLRASYEPRQASRIKDVELDLFHLPQFKEDRLDGFRRLANRDTDDSDDMTFEYDDNDDSNIDDIVNALSLSGDGEDDDRVAFGSDDEYVWDVVVNHLNNVSSLNLQGNVEETNSSCGLDDDVQDKLSSVSGGTKTEYPDDSDILEEVFFIHP